MKIKNKNEYPIQLNKETAGINYEKEVFDLLVEAKEYANSFKWCNKINNTHLYFNLGSILCIFLFEIDNIQSEEDNKIWIIVGDLPSMYLDTFGPRTTKEVLEDYSDLAFEWATRVINKKSIKKCFPFNEEPIRELAEMLLTRVDYIRKSIIPSMDEIKL